MAQQTSLSNSIAQLQEFLTLQKVKDTIKGTNDGKNATPLDRMLIKHPNWFYSHGSNNYVIQEMKDTSGNTSFYELRLINKKGLESDHPDVTKNMNGGEAEGGNDSAYIELKDVYGVTDDLEVYYCSDGIATLVGADAKNSAIFDSSKIIYNKESGLAKALAVTTVSVTKNLTYSDLKSIDELNITPESGLKDLTELYDLTNLKKLTLTNYQGSMEGIQNAIKLSYLYINNQNGQTNIDYSGLSGANNISELYFYNPTDSEVDKMTNEMSKGNYPLKTLGLYGYMHPYFSSQADWRCTMTSNYRTSLTSVKYLDRLSSSTKQNVTTLFLQNNKLTSIEGLNGFINVNLLQLTSNNLNDISAVKNMKKIISLRLNENQLNNNSLKSIEKISSLKNLMLQGNQDITSLESVAKTNPISKGLGTNINYLNAENLQNLNFEDDFWTKNDAQAKDVIGSIQQLLIPRKYSLYLTNKPQFFISSDTTDQQFSTLNGNKNIKYLSINNNYNITQNSIEQVILSMPNLETINLSNTNCSSIDFLNKISDKSKLRAINLLNTKVTDITPLFNFTKLGCLAINNDKIKLYDESNQNYNTNVTNLINRISGQMYGSWADDNTGNVGGFCPINANLQSQMKNLTGVSSWSFNCGSLVMNDVDLRNWKNLTYLGGYNGGGKIYIPSTIKNFGADSNATFYLDNPQSNFNINLSFSREVPVITNNTKNYTLVVNSLTRDANYYQSLFTNKVTLIHFDGGGEYLTTSTQGVDYTSASNLGELWINNMVCNKLDLNLIPTSLHSLTLMNAKTSNVNNFEKMTNLTYLNLSNNNISDLGFLDKSNNLKLETIDLRNNKITTYITINGKTIKTCEILSKIKTLKNIYLSGNSDLNDFSELTNAGFKDDGNHNFTK